MIEAIAEVIAGLGLGVAKKQISGSLDAKKLHDALLEYIVHQNEYNELCSIIDEIDFQGLVDFIDKQLLEKISTRVFSPDLNLRHLARQDIITAAVDHSRANTKESKSRVGQAIAICLDIIYEFYYRQTSMKDNIIGSQIVDSLSEISQENTNIVLSAVVSAKEEVIASNKDSSLFSLDKALDLSEGGHVLEVGSGIKKVIDHISVSHPYYPDFGYDYINGRILSKPLTEQAQKSYPPKIMLTGKVHFADQHYNCVNCDPFDFAYRHQLSIILEVTNAEKFLGSKTDPIQTESSDLIGRTIVLNPPEFPPPIPCSIKVGDRIFFEYIPLRIQEIEDDGTYVFGNKDKCIPFYFEVRINIDSLNKPCFKISLNQASNKDNLNYLEFMSALAKEKNLHIFALSTGEDFISARINDLELKSILNSIDEKIDFLKRICIIEDFFKVLLIPHGVFLNNEYEIVKRISDLVMHKEVKGAWSEASMLVTLDDSSREKITSVEDTTHVLCYIETDRVKLFNSEFEFQFSRTFKNVKIRDYEKLIQKINLMDNGEKIKIVFYPTDDNEFIDTLCIPQDLISKNE